MKRIDIGAILKAKNPRLARWMPRFVICGLESIICAKKINFVLDNYSQQSPIEFISSTLKYMGVSYTLHDTENIPTDVRAIFAANHPLGGLDGLILAHGLAHQLPDRQIKFIVNDILMNIEPLRDIFVPINKHGSQSLQYAKNISELYKSDADVITFPAGLCSRVIDGKITDPIWKRNFVSKALENNRLIIPTYISAHNSGLFYQIAKWRKRLGIKANLEMILLPREMFAQKGKHIDIYFGKPIHITAEHGIQRWCEIIRTKTYDIAIINGM